MANAITEKKNAKKVQNVIAGDWVKFQGDWHTNAFQGLLRTVFKNDKEYQECYTVDSYIISITKKDDRYFVYAEEHEPEDLFDADYTSEGFVTLREAKKWAIEFGSFFEACWLDNEGISYDNL